MAELLVVTAVIAMLAAVLTPVYLNAKSAANQTICASHLHQASLAMEMYCTDYSDHFTPINYEPGVTSPDPATDRTWVQLLLPYATSFQIFRDPADNGLRPNTNGYFDEDLVPTDTYERYYQASLESDIGFNYIYLSPVIETNSATKTWLAEPLSTTDVDNPSRTLLFIDSVWGSDGNGNPTGGGNWLVVPPCRYEPGHTDTFPLSGQGEVFALTKGWSNNSGPATQYGHAWPWHSGRFNVARVDGSIKSITPTELVQGCSAQPGWGGVIDNPNAYMWTAH